MINLKNFKKYFLGLTTMSLAIYFILKKFGTASAFYNNVQDKVVFLLCFCLIEMITIFFSFFLFFIFFRGNSINTKIVNHVKKIPLINKLFFTWFTIFYAIPNKIIINNNFSSFKTSFIIFLILVTSFLFPIFILFYIIFWISVLQSYFFAVIYSENNYFKNFIDSKLFVNDLSFNKYYFDFFWGNMTSGGAGKAAGGLIGTFLGGLYKMSKDHEKENLRYNTKIEMEIHVNNAKHKPQTAHESLQLQKNVENHIIERDCPILYTEQQISKFGNKVFDHFS